jgi:membrane protein YqaA with SNARE-associated domain
MTHEIARDIWRLALFILMTAGLITLFFFINPEEIVALIGVETGYLLIFLTALIGISSFTSASFYATLVALASTGEFHPLLLALVAAPANALGDSIFFFLGHKGRKVLRKRYLQIFSKWIDRSPDWVAPVIAFLYTSLTPLPQDFLMISLGVAGAKFIRVFIAILLGNAVFIAMLSNVAMSGLL